MQDTVIVLKEPIAGHGGQVTQIALRPPTYREVMSLGEPVARGYSRTGDVIYTAENTDTIRAYAEALLKRPAAGSKEPHLDGVLLEQLSITDTLQLKDAVLGFFTAARLKLSGNT